MTTDEFLVWLTDHTEERFSYASDVLDTDDSDFFYGGYLAAATILQKAKKELGQ